MRILALLAIGMLATLASACIDLSTGEPSPPQLVAQTVITCLDCQLVDVTGVIDGDTIDTSVGPRAFLRHRHA